MGYLPLSVKLQLINRGGDEKGFMDLRRTASTYSIKKEKKKKKEG